jgi:hypothetical protein
MTWSRDSETCTLALKTVPISYPRIPSSSNYSRVACISQILLVLLICTSISPACSNLCLLRSPPDTKSRTVTTSRNSDTRKWQRSSSIGFQGPPVSRISGRSCWYVLEEQMTQPICLKSWPPDLVCSWLLRTARYPLALKPCSPGRDNALLLEDMQALKAMVNVDSDFAFYKHVAFVIFKDTWTDWKVIFSQMALSVAPPNLEKTDLWNAVVDGNIDLGQYDEAYAALVAAPPDPSCVSCVFTEKIECRQHIQERRPRPSPRLFNVRKRCCREVDVLQLCWFLGRSSGCFVVQGSQRRPPESPILFQNIVFMVHIKRRLS